MQTPVAVPDVDIPAEPTEPTVQPEPEPEPEAAPETEQPKEETAAEQLAPIWSDR